MTTALVDGAFLGNPVYEKLNSLSDGMGIFLRVSIPCCTYGLLEIHAEDSKQRLFIAY